MIITQKKFLAILQTLSIREIRHQLGRIRLKFTLQEIAFYLEQLHLHQAHRVTLKALWIKSETGHSYQSFCQNLDLCAKLSGLVFIQFNRTSRIEPSSLYNVIDTSLIPTKKPQHLSKKDFDQGKVTVRQGLEGKLFVHGLKWLAVVNRQGLIVKSQTLGINTPDIDVTKNPYQYGLPKGILLADKGFNSKEVRSRLQGCSIRLISPFKSNQTQQLSDKERRLYARRWSIETVFQTLKHDYGAFKLGTSSRYTLQKQKAVLTLAALSYNLSRL